MNISLIGKNALICGSTQGIGLAIAKELSLSGAHCILMARNENALKEAITQLNPLPDKPHQYLVADFSKPDEVKKTINSFVKDNTIHILINNSGGPKPGLIMDEDEEKFVEAFRQHIVCNQALAKAVLPGMKATGYGRIINIISTSVRIPIANLGVSNTIRAAVASWAKTLSNEVGRFNITVNSVLPGFIETQRLDAVIDSTAKRNRVSNADASKTMEATIPMKRFGKVDEIANVIAFLASPAASYVNGVSIPVDGGKTGTI